MTKAKTHLIALKDVAELLSISYDRLKNMYPYLATFPAALPKRNKHCKVCFNKDEVVVYANSGAFSAKAISAAHRAYATHIKSNLPPKNRTKEPQPWLDLKLARQFLTAKPIR